MGVALLALALGSVLAFAVARGGSGPAPAAGAGADLGEAQRARAAPAMVADATQGPQSTGPSAAEPSVLDAVTVPVLLLQGPHTPLRLFHDAVRHVADHVDDAHVREVADAGHFGPVLQPDAVADALDDLVAAGAAGR